MSILRWAAPALLFCALWPLSCSAEEKADPPKPVATPWTVVKDSGWKELEQGLDLREEQLSWKQAGDNSLILLELKFTAVRIDPRRFGFRIAFNPVEGKRSLADVARAEKAPVVANGAYFGQKGEPVTLLVSGGKALSKPSAGLPYSGVFSLDVKGRAAVRKLAEVPPPYEGLDFAVQNSPLLVAGGQPAYPEKPNPSRYRRTVIGNDAAGRVVLLVCDSSVGLGEMAEISAAPEAAGGFALAGAVNLDGGPSSGLAVEHEKAKVEVKTGPTIPHVIVVARREKPLPE